MEVESKHQGGKGKRKIIGSKVTHWFSTAALQQERSRAQIHCLSVWSLDLSHVCVWPFEWVLQHHPTIKRHAVTGARIG